MMAADDADERTQEQHDNDVYRAAMQRPVTAGHYRDAMEQLA